MSTICSTCGSNKILSGVRITDVGHGNGKHDLSIEMYKNPDALMFKGTQRYSIKANVCCSCGKVETFVEDPEKLWDDYQKNKQ